MSRKEPPDAEGNPSSSQSTPRGSGMCPWHRHRSLYTVPSPRGARAVDGSISPSWAGDPSSTRNQRRNVSGTPVHSSIAYRGPQPRRTDRRTPWGALTIKWSASGSVELQEKWRGRTATVLTGAQAQVGELRCDGIPSREPHIDLGRSARGLGVDRVSSVRPVEFPSGAVALGGMGRAAMPPVSEKTGTGSQSQEQGTGGFRNGDVGGGVEILDRGGGIGTCEDFSAPIAGIRVEAGEGRRDNVQVEIDACPDELREQRGWCVRRVQRARIRCRGLGQDPRKRGGGRRSERFVTDRLSRPRGAEDLGNAIGGVEGDRRTIRQLG